MKTIHFILTGMLVIILVVAAVSLCVTQARAAEAEKKYPDCGGDGPHLIYMGRYNIVGYDACEQCCGKTDGITKNGTVATVGRTIAANDMDFPLGTILWIDGIGERVVEDRGYMTPGVLDVFCNDHAECYAITGVYDVYVVEAMTP